MFGGWKDLGDGWFKGPKLDLHLTDDYKNFAESQRARWNLLGWLKVKFSQLRKTRKKGIN